MLVLYQLPFQPHQLFSLLHLNIVTVLAGQITSIAPTNSHLFVMQAPREYLNFAIAKKSQEPSTLFFLFYCTLT